MRKLVRKLKKYYFIETISTRIKQMELYKASYLVWYANFITIPLFGLKYTIIIGLNYQLCKDITEANEFMELQKYLYKLALISKKRK